MSELFLGLDIGTSSLKAIVVDAHGTVHARASARYATAHPAPDRAEQDPRDWLLALERALADIPAELRARIGALAVDGHVPSLVAVDRAGEPVIPSLIWQDSRATGEAARLEAQFGATELLLGTTLPWSASHLPAKAAWLAAAMPREAERTHLLLQPKDYVNWALTGEYATDAWSSKGLLHVGTLTPPLDLLAELGWSVEHIPRAQDPWSVLSGLTPQASARFGLPLGLPVAVGWSDAMASILAVGGFDRPSGVVLTGTSEIVGASSPHARTQDGLYLVPETVAPLALSYGPTQASGASLVWIARSLGLEVGAALDAAAALPTDARLPTFVPYIDGERAPIWNPAVRGVFLGLSSEHDAAHLVKAVALGAAMSARHVLDLARSATQAVPVAHIGGRGVDHPVWVQTRAEALGLPLRLHPEPHLTALGAAMLGALATGLSFAELDSMRSTATDYQPDDAELARGNEAYERYLAAGSIAIEWSTK